MAFVCRRSLKKPLTFCGITVIIYFLYLRGIRYINGIDAEISAHSGRHITTNLLSYHSFPSKETENTSRPGRKVLIAFDYWEQLTQATKSFVDLTVLAALVGRQVVVPFVKDSFFKGSAKTLSLYYNVAALNHTLRSRGHATLISWEEFQHLCKGRLDVLVHFKYEKRTNTTAAYRQAKREFFQCQDGHNNTLAALGHNLKVGRKICINVFAIDSVEKFENEVIKGLPCVGFAQWKGNNRKANFRAQFNLTKFSKPRLHYNDPSILFSSKLLQVARHFIARNLGPRFLSVHIRIEKILMMNSSIINMASATKCLSSLTTQIQSMRNVAKASSPIFVATDFAKFGSSSKDAGPAQKRAKSLMKILAPLDVVTFQPSVYSLTDNGAVAIVETIILASAKHIWILGGGSFQARILNRFLRNNKMNKKGKAKCKNEMCNTLCHF